MNLRPIIEFLAPAAFIGSVTAACSFSGCSSTTPPPQSDASKHEAADAAYLGDMLLCRDKEKYPTLTQSEACLAATRTRWHRLPDGGADGTYTDGGAQ